MNKVVVFALFTVPLLSLVLGAMVELRRDPGSLRSLRRTLPLAVAVVLWTLLLLPLGFDGYPSYWNLLANAMAALSFLVAVGSFFGGYKSRLSTALIFTGGLILTYLWLINRIVA